MKKQKESATIKGKPGPHTAQGKERSKKNSTQHGILAVSLFLLPGESAAKFNLLRQSLREVLDVVGLLEEQIADKIAVLMWREMRVDYAESAQIARLREARVLDLIQQRAFPSRALGAFSVIFNGLLSDPNSIVLERAIKVLGVLRADFERRGYDRVADSKALTQVYGFHVLHEGFPALYSALAALAGDAAERTNRSLGLEEVRSKTLAAFDAEIERITKLLIEVKNCELRHRDFGVQALVVSPPEVGEQLMRYEAHISKQIERLLNRLARIQAARRSGRL
jgi:hypothetical protein